MSTIPLTLQCGYCTSPLRVGGTSQGKSIAMLEAICTNAECAAIVFLDVTIKVAVPPLSDRRAHYGRFLERRGAA